MRIPALAIRNLNHTNMAYGKVFREGSDSNSYNNILQRIAETLLQYTEYLLIVIYLPLHWCGRVYKLFGNIQNENRMIHQQDLSSHKIAFCTIPCTTNS